MILTALILLILSVLVVAGLFLVKLGKNSQRPQIRIRVDSPMHESLWVYFLHKLGKLGNKLWHFVLEAKDLKPVTTKTIHDQYERVRKVFRIRIRTNENDPHWLPEAAELSVKAPQTAQSPEESYLQAIRKNPQDREAYEALGRLYLQNKNFADATEIYTYLTKLDPNRDTYYSNLGLAFYSVKNYAKAASVYEKALGLNNKIPARWINLALCYEATGDFTRAVRAITQAIQLDKRNLNYQMMLADVYLKIPNQVRAEEVLEQILSIDPTNRVAREKLMRLKI